LPRLGIGQPQSAASRRHRRDAASRVSTGTMIKLNETSSGVTFAVKVHPRAKKNAITGEVGDALKVALTAPPVDGKANAACIEFFAKLLNVPRSSVTIASGQSSRNKVIRVAGVSAEEVRRQLGV
jgi:uncharacterized protein (TIGR00251 family)